MHPLEGVNSITSEDAHLDRIGALLAGIRRQVGTEFSFYLHKVSKAVELDPAAHPGRGVCRRPSINAGARIWVNWPPRQDADPDCAETSRDRQPSAVRTRASRARHAADTTRCLRKLDVVGGFLLSSFDELKPRLLAQQRRASGLPRSLNTGRRASLFPRGRAWRNRRGRGEYPRHLPRHDHRAVRWRRRRQTRRNLASEELPAKTDRSA